MNCKQTPSQLVYLMTVPVLVVCCRLEFIFHLNNLLNNHKAEA